MGITGQQILSFGRDKRGTFTSAGGQRGVERCRRDARIRYAQPKRSVINWVPRGSPVGVKSQCVPYMTKRGNCLSNSHTAGEKYDEIKGGVRFGRGNHSRRKMGAKSHADKKNRWRMEEFHTMYVHKGDVMRGESSCATKAGSRTEDIDRVGNTGGRKMVFRTLGIGVGCFNCPTLHVGERLSRRRGQGFY